MTSITTGVCPDSLTYMYIQQSHAKTHPNNCRLFVLSFYLLAVCYDCVYVCIDIYAVEKLAKRLSVK